MSALRRFFAGVSPPAGRPLPRGLALALLTLMLTGSVVLAQSGATYDLRWNVLSGGGALSTGAAYRINYSFGQPSTIDLSTGASYQVGQGYWYGNPRPTAVELAYLEASSQGAGVVVEWATISEWDNLGFHLYRQVGRAGQPERLNAVLIPSRAPGEGQGAVYAWHDDTAQAGVLYVYTLEDVDAGGRRTRHGPVEARAPFAIFLPLMER